MTAKEIRKCAGIPTWEEYPEAMAYLKNIPLTRDQLLAEIAAQLAELNEILRDKN